MSNKKHLENYIPIQSQRITILTKLERLEEALILSSQERFQNVMNIQSQRLNILIKLERFEEALILSNDKRFQNYFPIQSQRITILMKLGRLEEALALSSEKRFQDYIYIQSQRITILTKLGRLEEALTLSNQKRFQNNEFIQEQRQHILKLRAKQQGTMTNIILESDLMSLLNVILNANNESFAELESFIIASNIKEWQKMILMVALYEKTNYPQSIIVKYLKQQQLIYHENFEILKIIKSLGEHIKEKNKIFNAYFYENLLSYPVSCHIDQERKHLMNLKENLTPNQKKRLTF